MVLGTQPAPESADEQGHEPGAGRSLGPVVASARTCGEGSQHGSGPECRTARRGGLRPRFDSCETRPERRQDEAPCLVEGAEQELARARPGLSEPQQFGTIYDQHIEFVWRTLRRFGVPECSLVDAAQDVFLVVYTKLGEFEGRSSLKTWIFGIARRVARDHRRRPLGRSNSERLEALPGLCPSGTEVPVEQLDAALLLERLLERLDPGKREAFILVEIEQMSVVEAAEALGANPNTVYSRLRAARSELAQALARLAAQSAWKERCQR